MPPASKTPYGPKSQVTYADPGYQPDGKARYPLDSESMCRAAWSYINMPKNAAKYTAKQLATIKARIRAAGRKYGITFSDEVKAAAMAELRDVELARPGPWRLSSGQKEITAAELRDAADFFAASGGQAVPIKLGHVDDRFDGEPTFGSVTNVRYDEDDRGPVLRGNIVDMPDWLAAAAPKRWPNRSVEGWQNFSYGGRTYSLVLSGLAFLGVTPPAVRNIRSLADLQTALAASSAQRVVASAPADDPAAPPQTPAPEADAPPTTEGAGMSLAKYREVLAGLPDDASEDDVTAALAAAGLAPTSSPPAPVPTVVPAPEPVAASGSDQQLDQRIAAAAARGGVVTIDAAQVAQFQEGMVRAAALAKRLDEQDRDNIITEAIRTGKFPPARREHYQRAWDVDPAGTRELIASLAAGLVPVTASGYDGDDDAVFDAEYRHLFPPIYGNKAGGSRG